MKLFYVISPCVICDTTKAHAIKKNVASCLSCGNISLFETENTEENRKILGNPTDDIYDDTYEDILKTLEEMDEYFEFLKHY